MYLSYDFQSSHQGYIDFEFKEIVEEAPDCYSDPLEPYELFDAVIDGYYFDGKVPKYMSKVFDYEGNLNKARVSKRLVKLWCKRACYE